MKTLTAAIITLALATSVHANFINLIPGGYNYSLHGHQPPQELFGKIINPEISHFIDFFDSAEPGGWVSQFGVLNGGTHPNYFLATDLINGPEPFASIAYDL